MKLEEFANSLPALKDEAKSLWGIGRPMRMTQHLGLNNDEEYIYQLITMIHSDNARMYLKNQIPKGGIIKIDGHKLEIIEDE